MSCVVGLLQNGKLYMGSDGIATTEDGEKRPVICIKVFTNKKYLLGYSGSVRHGQLVGPRHFDPPTNVLDFPDEIREIFEEKGAILSTERRLYELLIDFQMNEVFGSFTSIGSGAPYAMGSLFATQKWNSPEKRIKNALDAAFEYDRSCGEPYTIEIMWYDNNNSEIF